MNTILGNLNIEDVPAPVVEAHNSIGTIGKVEVKPTKSGNYLRVSVPLKYDGNRQYTARFNVRQEWFQQGFDRSTLKDNEKLQYDINFSRLTRGLFKGAGLTGALDFDRLEGLQVGFKTRVASKADSDPSEEIASFYPPSTTNQVPATVQPGATQAMSL